MGVWSETGHVFGRDDCIIWPENILFCHRRNLIDQDHVFPSVQLIVFSNLLQWVTGVFVCVAEECWCSFPSNHRDGGLIPILMYCKVHHSAVLQVCGAPGSETKQLFSYIHQVCLPTGSTVGKMDDFSIRLLFLEATPRLDILESVVEFSVPIHIKQTNKKTQCR